MSEHPSPFELECVLVGESNPALDAHLADCPECSAYLDGLRSERTAMLNEMPPAEFFLREDIQAAFLETEKPKGIRWPRLRVWVPVLVACAVALFVYTNRGPVGPAPSTAPNEFSGDGIRMKGQSIQVAVIRNRQGVQSRHTKHVSVHPGDALRVQVTVQKKQALTIGIVDKTGDWLPLKTGHRFGPGIHFVHQDAIQIDSRITRGRLIAGPPRAVETARRRGRYDGLTSLIIESQAAP